MFSPNKKVLILGHSSILSYLSYVFSNSSNYRTTVCLSEPNVGGYTKQNQPPQNWQWSILSSLDGLCHTFCPFRTFVSFDTHLSVYLPDASHSSKVQRGEKYDFIFLGFEFIQLLSKDTTVFDNISFEHTFFFIDITHNPMLLNQAKQLLSKRNVLALRSDIDCRIIKSDLTELVLLALDDIRVCTMTVNMSQIKENLNPKDKLCWQVLKDLKGTYDSFHGQEFNLLFTPIKPNSKAIKKSWEKLINMVSFYSITIISGEIQMTSILDDLKKLSVRGSFHELVRVANVLGIENIPMAGSTLAKEFLDHLEFSERVYEWRRSVVCKNKFSSPNFISSNKLFNDFNQGVTTCIAPTLLSIIHVAYELGIDTPYLEYIQTILLSHSATSQSKGDKRCLVQPQTRITPEKKILNLLPLNSFSSPNSPLICMALLYDNDNKNMDNATSNNQVEGKTTDKISTQTESNSDGESVEEMDTTLRDLIAGTEGLTYGEEYYDAPTALSDAVTNSPVPVPLTRREDESVANPSLRWDSTLPLQGQPYHYQIPSYFPQPPQPPYQPCPYPPPQQFAQPNYQSNQSGGQNHYYTQPYNQITFPPPSLPPHGDQHYARYPQYYQDQPRPPDGYGSQVGGYNPGVWHGYPNQTLSLANLSAERARQTHLAYNNAAVLPSSIRQPSNEVDDTYKDNFNQERLPSGQDQLQNVNTPSRERAATPIPQHFQVPPHHLFPSGPLTPNSGGRKKKRSFHHIQATSNRRTSAQKLHKNHTEILDALHFNGLMDHSTSSRYGDLDTSSVILNSANNSRGSKASSSSHNRSTDRVNNFNGNASVEREGSSRGTAHRETNNQ